MASSRPVSHKDSCQIFSPETHSTRFTQEQQRAMCQFFEWRLEKSVKDWNQISSSDPIWQRCIVILTRAYERNVNPTSTAMWIARLAKGVLNQHKEKGNLKRFFREHVLTNPVKIQEKLFNFINRMGLNQEAEYTCLIPSNPECIVHCKLLTENLPYPIDKAHSETYATKSRIFKGQLLCINEMDLLLDYTFEREKVCHEEIPVRSCSLKENFSAECESSIVLPRSRKGLKKCITASMDAAFSAKARELYVPIERKKFLASLAFAATITITVFLFVKPCRFLK